VIWVKRIVPLVLIAGIALGWWSYDKQRQEKEQELTEKYALVTAQAWINRAQYRGKPGSYRMSRSSILEAEGVTNEELLSFLKRYEDEPEKYLEYARLVRHYVDSLLTRRGF
jgi:hypothetical protein